ncbi:MAG: armadillo-type fold-containing protein [Fischerella sp.]|nr:armadillo-type fold-containing protein [Fischerella sp.]
MAQALSSWQQLVNQILNWRLSPEFKSGVTKKRILERFRGPGGFLGFLTIVVAMLLWNWQLLLASSVGVGIMTLVYSIPTWNWHLRWSEIRKFLNSPNPRLALAVTSGGIACVSTYVTFAIWFDSNNHWLATGLTLQGLGTLLTFTLLLWQIINFYGSQEENQLDELLVNLTETDPLKRLIAVRQITKLIIRNRVDASERQSVNDCLRLLLRQEGEPAIREAIFQGLQALERVQVLSPGSAEMRIPASAEVKSRVSC